MSQNKKYSLILACSVLFVLPACFGWNYQQDVQKIVNQQGVVAPAVLQLLSLTSVTTDGTLSDIVAQTQKNWLRTAGSERWDIQEVVSDKQQEMLSLFNQLSMLEEIRPQNKQYEHMMILGALFDTMVQRMQHAITLWKSGVRCNHIALLAGARLAVAAQGENKESFEKFCGHALECVPQTEAEMITFIYDHIDMPSDMRAVPVEIIDVPMLEKSDGTMRRPNTADTIEWWLKTNPAQGCVLAISNQPYVWYQQAVLETLLPNQFYIETVGSKSSDSVKLGVVLDTLARVLYQEQQRLLKK